MSKCLECGYYDKEKHYCPFYCQLIRETLNEAISFELEKIKAEIIKGKCKRCDIDVNIQKCLEEHNSLCDVDDILVIIDNHIKELKGENNEL